MICLRLKRLDFIQMQTTHWNRRRVAYTAIGLLLFYWIFSASTKYYEADVTLKNVKAKEVWEFLADFSKIRQLNPTM